MALIDVSFKDCRGELSCNTCGLFQHCQSPKMGVAGQGQKKILIIAEAPGADEDYTGEPMVGKPAQYLRDALALLGVDLDRDCWKINAVNCRPPNRAPTAHEIDCCRSEVVAPLIERLQPEKIFVLGSSALGSMLDGRLKQDKFDKWVGLAIPDRRWGCYVFPIWHPAHVMRMHDQDFENHFVRHLKNAVRWNEPYQKQYMPDVELLDERQALRVLREVCSAVPNWLAFDYETNTRNPRHPKAKILCAAMAWPEDGIAIRTVAFAFTSRVGKLFAALMADKRIPKIAQNKEFEDSWTRHLLGVPVRNWIWDTMVAAHVLDNRPGNTGLKFQGYVRFGLAGYDADVESYIHCDAKTGLNKMHKVPLKKMLTYCGIDAYLTARLYEVQRAEIKGPLQAANSLLQRGVDALMAATYEGICVDEEYLTQTSKRLSIKLDRLEKKIQTGPDAETMLLQTGKQLNPTSPDSVGDLMTKVLGVKVTKRTATGRPQVDETELRKHAKKHGVLAEVLELRELQKLRSTYVDGILDVTWDGFIHPQFNLHIVKTYRSSSNEPNFQNFPKRDQSAMKMIRRAIRPRPGRRLLAVDYGGVEVRISACVHQDPKMIEYIENPETDMHRDQAMELFFLSEDNVSKPARHVSKNGFVFPSFYGSYFESTAPAMWQSIKDVTAKDGTPLRDVLRENGISNKADWTSHVKECERVFWEQKFVRFAQWKKETWQEYLERGYVQLKTGFICRGPLRRNDVVNYQIQGPAFHCLLWSLIRVHRELRKQKFESIIVGQIHDEMVLDVVPEEADEVLALVRRVMLEDIYEDFDWIIVPLEVEAEMSAVDGNWSEMEVVA